MCAIGYVTVVVGDMFKASRKCEFSETMANWENVLACKSLMHLKIPLHSLKETNRSVNSYGRPWSDPAREVKGAKVSVVVLVIPLAAGAAEVVGVTPLIVENIEEVGGACPVTAPFIVNGIEAIGEVGPAITPLTVERVAGVCPVTPQFIINGAEAVEDVGPAVTPLTVETVGGVYPVTAPFIVNGMEAVEDVGPVVPLTVEPVVVVDVGGPTAFPHAATVLIGPKFVVRDGNPRGPNAAIVPKITISLSPSQRETFPLTFAPVIGSLITRR